MPSIYAGISALIVGGMAALSAHALLAHVAGQLAGLQ